MAREYRSASMAELLTEADQITTDVQSTFGRLSLAQLNWKPAPTEWSVGQCFDHLRISTRIYFPILRKLQNGSLPTTLFQRIPGLPGLCSSLLFTMLNPDGSKKVPAPAPARPSTSDLDQLVLQRFIDCHQELIGLMKSTRADDLQRVITSPLGAMVVYTVLGTYRINITHHRLHIGQAIRVMQTIGFPA